MKRYKENGIIRISKQMAKRMYENGKDVMLIPCNIKPHTIVCPVDTWVNNHMKEDNISFDTLCNAYTYTNCNKETGEYISFYIKE